MMYRELEVGDTELKQKLVDILREEFPDDEKEIVSGMNREKRHNYDYTNCIVPVLMIEETICAGAICVKHEFMKENNIKSHVWEIIWFATNTTIRSKKYGTKLFQHIYSKARSELVEAIVVTSTSKALSFWLTRPDVYIFRHVYGNFAPSSTGKGKFALRKLFQPQTDDRRAEKDVVELGEALFQYESWPKSMPHESLFYTDKIWHDRKGRISKSTVFEGRPYRYTLSCCSHVWFPIAKTLRKKLQSRHLLRRRRRHRRRKSQRGSRKKQQKRILPSENIDVDLTAKKKRSLVIVHPRVRRFWSVDFTTATSPSSSSSSSSTDIGNDTDVFNDV